MKSVSCEHYSRRRIAALAFLSNISLDGTHNDTKLGELNLNINFNKSVFNPIEGDSQKKFLPSTSSACYDYQQCKGEKNNKSVLKFPNPCEIKCKRHASELVSSESVLKSRNSDIKEQPTDRLRERLQSRKKERNTHRVHRFVSEAKARLCNLSLKRKLSLQKSVDSYGLPIGNSSESLFPGTSRSRKTSICPADFYGPAATEVKFLKNIKEYKNEAQRMVLISKGKSPFVLFSTLPYIKYQGSSKVESKIEVSRRWQASMRHLANISDGSDPFDLLSMLGIDKPLDGQDISYRDLLSPSNISRKFHQDLVVELDNSIHFPYHFYPNSHRVEHVYQSPAMSTITPKYLEMCPEKEELFFSRPWQTYCATYHPDLLDDPELMAGKHRTLLVFPSYVTSVIDYVKPSDLKKDLNEKFRERFPYVKLTLSKLRSLKKEMCKIVKHECNLDISVVAQAYVYFEKLILKILVNKHNRKHCAGACILLSAKLNDIRGHDLSMLLEKIESIFRINRKDLLSLEFGILVALEFSLLYNNSEVLPHYQRLVYEA